MRSGSSTLTFRVRFGFDGLLSTTTGFTLTISRVRDLEFTRREAEGSSRTP